MSAINAIADVEPARFEQPDQNWENLKAVVAAVGLNTMIHEEVEHYWDTVGQELPGRLCRIRDSLQGSETTADQVVICQVEETNLLPIGRRKYDPKSLVAFFVHRGSESSSVPI